jgi:hypothetical protein
LVLLGKGCELVAEVDTPSNSKSQLNCILKNEISPFDIEVDDNRNITFSLNFFK